MCNSPKGENGHGNLGTERGTCNCVLQPTFQMYVTSVNVTNFFYKVFSIRRYIAGGSFFKDDTLAINRDICEYN